MSLENETKRISRRALLRVAALASGTVALAACGGQATPAAPTSAPAAGATTAPAAAATKAPAAAATSAPVLAPTKAPASTAAPAGVKAAKGGTLRVATIGEPPSLDPMFTTANITWEITSHITEGLYTIDEKLNVIPQLVEKTETSNEGKTRTLTLRKGIKFHNGKEMTAEDVEASILRWSKMAGLGKTFMDKMEAIEKPNPYTMVFKMKSPFAIFENTLGFRSQSPVIMPKEEVEAATEKNQITKPIGTGPYKFVEHQKDRFVRLQRFDGYHMGIGDKPNGAGGKKDPFFDEIRFFTTPDQSVRVAGVQSGEFEHADGINPDQYTMLKDSKTVSTLISSLAGKCPTHYINKKSPITADVKLRQAMNAVIDCEAALKAGWGSPNFYDLNGATMPRGGPWYSEVSVKENFNQKNLEKAKKLLGESKYGGEPIRYLTNKEYPNMYQEAVVINQNLQSLGLNMKMEVIDWASVIARRAKPEEWELFVTWNGYYTDPSLMDWMNPAYAGWWTNDKIDPLRDKLIATVDPKQRFAIFEDVQRLFWEEIPILKLGDVYDLALHTPKLKGAQIYPTPYFWHAFLEK